MKATDLNNRVGEVDRRNMHLALSLARRGLGSTHPNPSVGCVIVEPVRGRVVGRGWTRPGGRPHAETEALGQAGSLARGGTAYITLEPCSHKGKTPACCDALIGAGIARVFSALQDPDHRVAGSGHARLRAAGLDVLVGLLAHEARQVNRGYLTRRDKGRPWVSLKIAMSIDGRIATGTGDSQWITGPRSRSVVHTLRARHDAILTGSGTVRADDPTLTCRLPGMGHFSPLRVVMNGFRGMPADCRMMRHADVVPVRVFGGDAGRLAPRDVLHALAGDGINSVLVEAGAGIVSAFLQSGFVDEIWSFCGPRIIGSDGLSGFPALGVDRLEEAKHFRLVAVHRLGDDTLAQYGRAQSSEPGVCSPEL